MPTLAVSRAGNAAPSYPQMLGQLQALSRGVAPAPLPLPVGDTYLGSGGNSGLGVGGSIPYETTGLGDVLQRLGQWIEARGPVRNAAPVTPAPTPAAPVNRTCTVRQGDSLSTIAKRELGDGNRWPAIFDLNRDRISNPNRIYPGQVLKLPGLPSATAPAASAPAKPSSNEPWAPTPGRLEGGDTSNWQSSSEFETSIQGAPWTAIKASQGTDFTDATFRQRWDLLGKKIDDGAMKLRMAYVYLDPGDGVAQAKHFLDVVGVHGKLPAGTRLVLDWEGPALESPDTLR